MAFRVEVRPAWNVFPGEPGEDVWVPVLDDTSECEFATVEPARALRLVVLFAIRRLNPEPFREVRINEFLDEDVTDG